MFKLSQNHFYSYIRLMRLDKPIGAFLLLWPTLWALWLAGEGQPNPSIVILFMLGTMFMRCAGCVINDFADKDFDLHVERTRDRPLTSGEITPSQALTLFIALLGLSLCLVLFLNILSFWVACAAVVIATTYPYAKRYTHLPQLVLGLAFSMGIPMAYAAITNQIPWEAWALFSANFLWIVAYDTQYAMADREHDIKIGIKSTAILFGQNDRIIIATLQSLSLVVLLAIGFNRDFSWHYYLGLFAATLFWMYQNQLIKHRDPASCFKAFLNNTWVGAMIFSGIVLALIES